MFRFFVLIYLIGAAAIGAVDTVILEFF